MLWCVCSHTRVPLPPGCTLSACGTRLCCMIFSGLWLLFPCVFRLLPCFQLDTSYMQAPSSWDRWATQYSSPFEPGSEQATLGSRACPDPATAGSKPSRHRPCHPVKEETLQQGPAAVKSLPRSPQKAAVELNRWASWLACSGELKIKLSVQTRCSNVMTLI